MQPQTHMYIFFVLIYESLTNFGQIRKYSYAVGSYFFHMFHLFYKLVLPEIF